MEITNVDLPRTEVLHDRYQLSPLRPLQNYLRKVALAFERERTNALDMEEKAKLEAERRLFSIQKTIIHVAFFSAEITVTAGLGLLRLHGLWPEPAVAGSVGQSHATGLAPAWRLLEIG